MLDVALKFLQAELNSYLLVRTASDFGDVELGKPVDDSGRWAITEDHIGCSLIGIEEERALRTQLPTPTYLNGRQVLLEPDIKLNLHVLFAAYFRQYDQALKQLSHVLTFFQSHTVFTPDRNPGLDPRIEKLSVELQSLSFEQINQIWAFLGGKHLPSAAYRVRLVALQDTEPASADPPVGEMTVGVARS